MVLNEIAMAQQLCMDWSSIHEDGPPHQRSFTWTLKMGPYEAVGSGNSKKVAKTIAAQNMYQVVFFRKKNFDFLRNRLWIKNGENLTKLKKKKKKKTRILRI